MTDVVRRQKELGIDVPGDGEFGKPMAQRVNYGSWWSYSWNRLGGLDPTRPQLVRDGAAALRARSSRAGTSFGDCRDCTLFAAG